MKNLKEVLQDTNTGIFYHNIEKVTNSLRMSTDIVIYINGLTYKFGGRNSDIISHKTCNIETNEFNLKEHKNVLSLANNKYSIIIIEDYDLDNSFLSVEGQAMAGYLPSDLFSFPFPFPVKKPQWLIENKKIMGIIPDNFDGYNKDGSPIFSKDKNIYVVESEEERRFL